jgi:hypothetical protein
MSALLPNAKQTTLPNKPVLQCFSSDPYTIQQGSHPQILVSVFEFQEMFQIANVLITYFAKPKQQTSAFKVRHHFQVNTFYW